jgi:hypothetical protein
LSTTTSKAEGEARLAEARRVRLERLLQCTARDYELRFGFGDSDRVGRGRIQARAEAPAQGPVLPLKASALRLLGHLQAENADARRRALSDQEDGRPLFAALWTALENARVENRMIERWPGMRTTFASRLLPNLGGSLVRVMGWADQLRLGLYLEGRGYRGAQYVERVRDVLETHAVDIRKGADGETPQVSLEAMRRIYPALLPLLRLGGSGRTVTESLDDRDRKSTARPEGQMGAPDIEMSDELVEVGLQGRPHQLPDWIRPGSAPWFERGLGAKKIHPTAVRPDRQTLVTPPVGDLNAYRALWGEVQREAGFLATRMTNLLREDTYLRFGGQYRSGKLHTAKLYKQRLGNFRLFERSTVAERSIAFQLLVDESASMKGGDKARLAVKTVILLGETLDQVGLPFEIIGFTTAEYEASAAMRLGLRPAHAYRTMRCSPLEHRIYKRFEEPFPLVRRRLTGIEPRHNNWDEEHLLFAYRRLQARPELRKVMIVISDGQPNGDAEHLIAVVARLAAQGCTVIGVGIGADFVRQVYRRPLVVQDLRQLAEELLTVLAAELGLAVRAAGDGRPNARAA